ncbi:unnamed protein product [Bemisia tabaci]|uniref:Reverse transcriptase domain-containing protein n=1 Tax=Bemisia tabaci TaxID=7038 RepID=A0A9P0EZM7_BEMTA|nr:unnamed protein product [Bemisia tabaci]
MGGNIREMLTLLTSFGVVEECRVEGIIGKLKNSVGDFPVCSTVIKAHKEHLTTVITEIVNKSFKEGIMPKALKKAVISPIPKVKNTIKVEEMRPINSLPVVEKIVEGAVIKELVGHIENNNILIEEQRGFRKGRGTEDMLQMLFKEWREEDKKDKVIVGVFLDLKRAFETIDRAILVRKLENIGINGKALEWLKNYLSDRKQVVNCDDKLSDEICVELGVPQGSRLGPILFLVYINDLKGVLDECKLRMFADDTLIYLAGYDTEELQGKLSAELTRVDEWLKVNKLKLNISKSKYVVFSSNEAKRAMEVLIKIGEEKIERVKMYKYLGVLVTDDLKWDKQVEKVSNEYRKRVSLLWRVKNTLTIEDIIKVMKYVDNLNYHPNHLAVKLLDTSTNTYRLARRNVMDLQSLISYMENRYRGKNRRGESRLLQDIKQLNVE